MPSYSPLSGATAQVAVIYWISHSLVSPITTISNYVLEAYQVPGILFSDGLSSPNTLSPSLNFQISKSTADF